MHAQCVQWSLASGLRHHALHCICDESLSSTLTQVDAESLVTRSRLSGEQNCARRSSADSRWGMEGRNEEGRASGFVACARALGRGAKVVSVGCVQKRAEFEGKRCSLTLQPPHECCPHWLSAMYS